MKIIIIIINALFYYYRLLLDFRPLKSIGKPLVRVEM